ncbi:hypothetical protein F2Q68_00044355 [Brassica cretica]|uniref:Uncharacterized protein n=1 Tax=Brassica cretica TaxID=69181 RepID=A0A8S9LJJ6_BRACR|nr:hypothetical protein F2Q68_00044355 [Brassica cretica]
MFRLHFAYMSPYQVLEYHMEFLETFGCNWSPKEVFKVIIGRAPYRSDQSGATPSSRSDLPIRATLPERQGRVARVLITRRCENESGATSRSDTARSLPKHGATTRSDERRLSEYLHSQCFDIPQNWFDNHYTTTFVLGALKTPNIRHLCVKRTLIVGQGDEHVEEQEQVDEHVEEQEQVEKLVKEPE